jgi:membrane dipeptidase
MPVLRLVIWVALFGALAFPQSRKPSQAEVQEVHRSAILIDTHNDVPMRTARGMDFGPRAATGHTDLVRVREGGVGAVFFSGYVARGYAAKNQSAHRALEMIDSVHREIVERYPERPRLQPPAAPRSSAVAA